MTACQRLINKTSRIAQSIAFWLGTTVVAGYLASCILAWSCLSGSALLFCNAGSLSILVTPIELPSVRATVRATTGLSVSPQWPELLPLVESADGLPEALIVLPLWPLGLLGATTALVAWGRRASECPDRVASPHATSPG